MSPDLFFSFLIEKRSVGKRGPPLAFPEELLTGVSPFADFRVGVLFFLFPSALDWRRVR